MLEMLFWLSSIFRTISIISLVRSTQSKHDFCRTNKISMGFLAIFINQILLFSYSFLIEVFVKKQDSQFSQVKFEISIFLLLLYSVIFMVLKKKFSYKLLEKSQWSVLVNFMLTWFILLCLGMCSSLFTQPASIISKISFILAFYQSIIKYYYQYKFDKINGYYGLGYGFLIGEIGWVVFGLSYEVFMEGDICGLEILLIAVLGYQIWVKSTRQRIIKFITGQDVRKRFFQNGIKEYASTASTSSFQTLQH